MRALGGGRVAGVVAVLAAEVRRVGAAEIGGDLGDGHGGLGQQPPGPLDAGQHDEMAGRGPGAGAEPAGELGRGQARLPGEHRHGPRLTGVLADLPGNVIDDQVSRRRRGMPGLLVQQAVS